MDQKNFSRSIGFDGPDGTNKSRFAKFTVRMLREVGMYAQYCPLPSNGTVAGAMIVNAKRFGIAKEAIPVLYMTDRAELVDPIKEWVNSSPQHWIVFDRTKESGPAYGEALGGNFDWLKTLELPIPDVSLGFLLTKPYEESRTIIGMRSNLDVSLSKAALDDNSELQIKVRRTFERLIEGRQNWFRIDVGGIARNMDEFKSWELNIIKQIWTIISSNSGHPEWLEELEKGTLERARIGMYRNEAETAFTDSLFFEEYWKQKER